MSQMNGESSYTRLGVEEYFNQEMWGKSVVFSPKQNPAKGSLDDLLSFCHIPLYQPTYYWLNGFSLDTSENSRMDKVTTKSCCLIAPSFCITVYTSPQNVMF